MTQSSDAETEALPVVVGALTHARLPRRTLEAQPIRIRVRVPLDVLEATSAGLRELDERYPRQITETPPQSAR